MASERRKRESSATTPGSGVGLWPAVLLLFAVSGAGQGLPSMQLASALQGSILTKKPVRPPSHPDDTNHLTASFAPPGSEPTAAPAGMFFATDNNTAVTSQTGSNALLPCIIKNMDDGMVSWIRRKDRHLLTVGLTTYTSDERYQAIHFLHSEDWTLQIKFVQKRDAGLYECQVSSHPPTSIFLQLNVVEARAQITGPADKYIKPGSALRLQCVILKTTEQPAFVFWYHNSRMINFDLDRGVNVSTDLTGRTSDLYIPATGATHAGNYSCVPNNAQPASIYVHIFNGENPAAMQSAAECRHTLCSRRCNAIIIIAIATSIALCS